ncbi:hypothetical protein QJS04_geneDACA021719 [Acorus gramineus]|uniref:Uncharacterized protein n=1 Tax=Acorus gramineus TaxID=55184 RepID=A0AAV9AFZ5_ACOGR|nr:hypothetical protein QJS04_geneDACA021719 [Acorus gramineus]
MANPGKFVSVNLNKSYGRHQPTQSPSNASLHRSARPGSAGGGGGGGGMVVLSRPRSSSSGLQKAAAPRLSVPSPLNLPSLRKEHEQFDPSSSAPVRSDPGQGSRSGSSSMGWTKPGLSLITPSQEREAGDRTAIGGGGVYTPPSARPGATTDSSVSVAAPKAVVLRGEDFPSLLASLPSASVPGQKQPQKQRPTSKDGERGGEIQMPPSRSPPLTMRPQNMRPTSSRADGRGPSSDGTEQLKHHSKMDGTADPLLPLVRLTRTSDWADDERDTGYGPPPERERDYLPQPPRVAPDGRAEPAYNRDTNRSWRSALYMKDGFGSERDGFSNREMNGQDSWQARRDSGHGNNVQNGFGGRVSTEQNNRGFVNRGRNNFIPKSSFSLNNKGSTLSDPIGRDRRLFNNEGKPYMEDSIMSDFDDTKIFKRRRDVMMRQAEYHDPVRESFEAELERVQMMQEQERQRALEEQARVMELARKEEEERDRLVKEEEERRRRVEEDAREAAWRAEQEKLEALRKAEEQRLMREEEKKRYLLEEERRKTAARQKLLELEARMANKDVGKVAQNDDKVVSFSSMEDERGAVVKDREVQRDAGDWEEGERMVERITSSASSDSSSLNRFSDLGLRPHSSTFSDGGKHTGPWRKETFSNVNTSGFGFHEDNGSRSPGRDAFGTGRMYTNRPSSKGGTSESQMTGDFRPKLNRWTAVGDSDYRSSDIDGDFLENPADKYGDSGWGHGRSRGSPYEFDGMSSFRGGRLRHQSMRQPRVLPPPTMASSNAPASNHRIPFRADEDHIRSSGSFVDSSDMRNSREGMRGADMVQPGSDSDYRHEKLGQAEITEPPPPQRNSFSMTVSQDPKEGKDSPRCDSQSSLSVSSPPTSPTHLSHDDELDGDDNSGESPIIPSLLDGRGMLSSEDSQAIASVPDACNLTSSEVEDEEWVVEDNERIQEQEEYDEVEDGYLDEDEIHEGDGENCNLSRELEDLHLDGHELTMDDETCQQALGFDDGVENGIPTSSVFETTSADVPKELGLQTLSVGAEQELETAIGSGYDGLQTDNAFSEASFESSHMKKMVLETEKVMPIKSHEVENMGATSNSVVVKPQAQLPVASAANMPLPSAAPIQPILPAASAVSSQADHPVNLQFGLFSGPSLIPSPVPAIQIGSIQMPLHLHHAQPSLFLGYHSSLPQGMLPVAHQTMSFVQHSTIPTHYHLNQKQGLPLHSQPVQDSISMQSVYANDRTQNQSVQMESQPGSVFKVWDEASAKGLGGSELKESPPSDNLKDEVPPSQSHVVRELMLPKQHQGNHDVIVRRNYRSISRNRETHVQMRGEPLLSSERATSRSKAQGMASGGRGKRYVYAVRNSNLKSSFPASQDVHADSGSGFQRRARRNVRRMEFRVRGNVDGRTSDAINSLVQGDILNSNGRSRGPIKNGGRRDSIANRPNKLLVESESSNSNANNSGRAIGPDSKMRRTSGREAEHKQLISATESSNPGEGNLKRSGASEIVDAPLQTGVVRVYTQPGIEAPSDEDDFIEVRSKRQMLNDRREQREREIKAKSRIVKAPRKPRSFPHNNAVMSYTNRRVNSLAGEAKSNICSEPAVTDGGAFANSGTSDVFTTSVQTLPPIGTPAVNNDASDIRSSHNVKSIQQPSVPGTSVGGTNIAQGLPFKSNSVTDDNLPASLVPWGNTQITQQVITLTQNQLDDAMKPAHFDTHVTSIGDHTNVTLEVNKRSKPIVPQDKPYSSPLNSLLAGEKIQFGAVTSPTILPSVSCAISNGTGLPGSRKPDVPLEHNNLSLPENNCTMFYDKEKIPNESCGHLDDPEAEAEAAASAVAVAAITSDEGAGGPCSVSNLETKSFGAANVDGLTSESGVTNNSGQSRAEESLAVALPADLSVETPSLHLWPPMPNPQTSNNPMLSHYPGAPPSHFPCFEMNPMLGAPIFAFGPHDDSAGTQSQTQRSTALGSGPLGAWQPCHSGVDSFYGPPAGYTGPFITPPGGIPGVQGHPHMVVYNHFAPVGQFGQVGLSYMGTTAYVPSGKQPDWKHGPVSTGLGANENDMNNMNMVSGQRNPSSIPAPIQHLTPGSPLMPIASPLAMFDISPFQPSPDLPVQACWPHLSPSPLHSVPLQMPMHQRKEGAMPIQFSHGPSVDPSAGNPYHEVHPTMPADDSSRQFPISANTAAQFPDELPLGNLSGTSTLSIPTSRVGAYSATSGNSKGQSFSMASSRTSVANASESGGNTGNSNTKNSSSSSHSLSSTSKSQAPQQQTSASQYLQPIGYLDNRGGGTSQKTGSGGGEWHRRMGFHGRNHASGPEKNIGNSKVKQIYVAKPSTSGSATAN